MTAHFHFSPVFLSALAIVAVNGLGLAFCHFFNKNKEAERYYKNFEPIKFHVMNFCYTILLISLSFNLRFLFFNSASQAWRNLLKPKMVAKMKQVTPTLYSNLKANKVV